jgi:hypothetical protein
MKLNHRTDDWRDADVPNVPVDGVGVSRFDNPRAALARKWRRGRGLSRVNPDIRTVGVAGAHGTKSTVTGITSNEQAGTHRDRRPTGLSAALFEQVWQVAAKLLESAAFHL